MEIWNLAAFAIIFAKQSSWQAEELFGHVFGFGVASHEPPYLTLLGRNI